MYLRGEGGAQYTRSLACFRSLHLDSKVVLRISNGFGKHLKLATGFFSICVYYLYV